MSEEVFGTYGKTDVIGGLTDFLCDSISFLFSGSDGYVESIRCVETTAKEFQEKLMALDDADKELIWKTVMDIFIKDSVTTSEFISKIVSLERCSGVGLLVSQANYEVSLPPDHGKVFLRKKVQCSFDNLKQVYDRMGDSMIEITDDDEYAKALISHMVLYRSLCNYEEVLDCLKKRRFNVENVYKSLFETSVALLRFCALISNEYSLDEMQSTYAKMLAKEPLFILYGDKGEAIS